VEHEAVPGPVEWAEQLDVPALDPS
jgi:hypothetical protein